jgi:hypothetical protein
MSKFGFDKTIRKMQEVKRVLPNDLANDAVRFFLASWDKQGFDDGGVKSWKPRKKETPKTQGKPILVGTGNLRRAVANSKKEATWERIRLQVDMPKGEQYPVYINEGTDKMPKRQFMGDSKTLRDILQKKINLVVDKIWRE